MEEVREIAALLQQRIDAADEITVGRRALVNLIMAHGTMTKSKNKGDEENDELRLSLRSCQDETTATNAACAIEVRAWKGRFWITIGGVAAVTTIVILAN